jgi:uncharacterized protein (TIGR03067 family)
MQRFATLKKDSFLPLSWAFVSLLSVTTPLPLRTPIMLATRIGSLALLAASILAATVRAEPETQPPAGGFTVAKLKEAIGKLGYDLMPHSTDEIFWISVNREKTAFSVRVSLSSDRTNLWMTTPLNDLSESHMTNQEAIRRLLQENETIGPARFSFLEAEKNLRLQRPTPNRDMSAVKLRKEIESFDALARKTKPLWLREAFIRIGSVPPEVLQEGRDHLKGEWQVLEMWNFDKPVPTENIQKTKPVFRFDGDKVHTVNGGSTSTANYMVDPRGKLGRIDLIEKNVATHGIYKLENDTLTLLFSAIGDDRPTDAEMKPNPKVIKIVLKRAGKP